MYKIDYRWKRLRVVWRRWHTSLNETMVYENRKITPYEEKAIKLWKLLLKDEDTQMSYNTIGVRQLEKENVFMIFQQTGSNDYLMTLVDINDQTRSLYELHIPDKHAEIVCDSFDIEMEKRMKKNELNALSIIEYDIDKLIEKEELAVLQRMKK